MPPHFVQRPRARCPSPASTSCVRPPAPWAISSDPAPPSAYRSPRNSALNLLSKATSERNGFPNMLTKPRWLLHMEGAFYFALALSGYYANQYGLRLFAVLFLVP